MVIDIGNFLSSDVRAPCSFANFRFGLNAQQAKFVSHRKVGAKFMIGGS